MQPELLGILDLVAQLAATRSQFPALDLSMATNGILLRHYANDLHEAGLGRVTVSLTTLDDRTFAMLIGHSTRLLKASVAGIEAAVASGLSPVKLNMPLYHSARRDIGNLHELADVVRFAMTNHATLASLGTIFADHAYPKIAFGVDIGSLRLGFEAMKRGRLAASMGLQEGPYALRLSTDGAMRATLNGEPDFRLIDAVREGVADTELRAIFRIIREDMP